MRDFPLSHVGFFSRGFFFFFFFVCCCLFVLLVVICSCKSLPLRMVSCCSQPQLHVSPAVSTIQYVAGRQCFEFGPLLSGKAPPPHPEADVAAEAHHQANQERLRITNCGLFPCRVDLLFEEPTQEDGREVFSIHPPVLDLDPEETREVVLRAYPQTVGEIRNSLVCCVHGNPYVLRLPVSCVGTKPALEVFFPRLD